MDELSLRTGFEIELLAPAGSDRQVLADELAARLGGQVRRSFHTDSEPSVVPGVGVFRHLSPAFDVVDADGRPWRGWSTTSPSRPTSTPRGPGRQGWYRRPVRRRPAAAAGRAARRPRRPAEHGARPGRRAVRGARRGRRPRGPGRRRPRCHGRRGDAAAGGAGAPVRDHHAADRDRPRGGARAAAGPGARARLHRPAGGRGAPARRRGTVPPAGGLRQRRPAVRALAAPAVGGAGHQPRVHAAGPVARQPAGPRGDERRRSGTRHRPHQVRRREPHAARHRDARCATRSRCGSCPARSTARASCGGPRWSRQCSPAASTRARCRVRTRDPRWTTFSGSVCDRRGEQRGDPRRSTRSRCWTTSSASTSPGCCGTRRS